MRKIGNLYVGQTSRPFFYRVRTGQKRHREAAGTTPTEASNAQRRKPNELVGELLAGGKELPSADETTATSIQNAITMFTDHVRTHSPDKPKTLQCQAVNRLSLFI